MSIFKKASKFHEKHLLAVSFPLCMGMVLSAWSLRFIIMRWKQRSPTDHSPYPGLIKKAINYFLMPWLTQAFHLFSAFTPIIL